MMSQAFARRSATRKAVGFAVFLVTVAVAAPQAAARIHHHRAAVRHLGATESYHPPSASIVVDANSGKVIEEENADSPRHPASLTKIMTLYLLFEAIEAGRFGLDTPLEVSSRAASQAPTKLGLRPGQTIVVEDAIKALITRSANDAAVVVAEAVGGTEDQFAERMTAKARALGMNGTVYTNASGLPDDNQVTTARDQAQLGRAIQDRFWQFYHYFSTPSFEYHGIGIGNHNHLLGAVEGVDGIKTGYTRASGYNLVSSVHRAGRALVAVVLGGSSGGARDARMRELIEQTIATASTRRTAPVIVEADPAPPPATTEIASASSPRPAASQQYSLESASTTPAGAIPSAPRAQSESRADVAEGDGDEGVRIPAQEPAGQVPVQKPPTWIPAQEPSTRADVAPSAAPHGTDPWWLARMAALFGAALVMASTLRRVLS